MYELRGPETALWGDDVRQSAWLNTEPAAQPWVPRSRAQWRYWESARWLRLLDVWRAALGAAVSASQDDYVLSGQRVTWSEPTPRSEHAAGEAADALRPWMRWPRGEQ